MPRPHRQKETGLNKASMPKQADESSPRQLSQLVPQHMLDPGSVVDGVFVASIAWATSLYHDIVNNDAIEEYLRDPSSRYHRDEQGNGFWSALPNSPSCVRDLHAPVLSIVTSILGRFSQADVAEISREAELTAEEVDGAGRKTRPDICIAATGPSFQVPFAGDDFIVGVGYSNLASAIDVVLSVGPCRPSVHAAHAEHYSRQLFVKQPNRDFFRSLVVTEKSARLVHCDRGGVYVTPFINIHDDPRTFIRWVVGTSSIDETKLGIDISVQWEVDYWASGLKRSGTVRGFDEEGVLIEYPLDDKGGRYTRGGSIQGRGTTCYGVTHPKTGQKLVIKDAWRPESFTSEIEFLVAARGLDGIAQLVSFKDFCAQTNDYRPPGFSMSGYHNRVKLRMVMERYGDSLEYFDSRTDLVLALRDAISAHRELAARGILHRDISLGNILLRYPGTMADRIAVLIDLDTACWAKDGVSERPTNASVGTRRFQSIAVLRSDHPTRKVDTSHSYLDDLESFFYVLCYVLFAFEEPKVMVDERPEWLEDWNGPDPKYAAMDKQDFWLDSFPSRKIPEYWGAACARLAEGFRKVLYPTVYKTKQLFWGAKSAEVQTRTLKKLRDPFDATYDAIDELFRVALVEIAAEDSLNSAKAPSTALHHAPAAQRTKRARGQVEPDVTARPRKRARASE